MTSSKDTHTRRQEGRSRPRSHGDARHVTVQIWSGGGRSPALGNLGSPLLTHLRVGLDEVDQATVLGTIGSGEAQGAWLTGTDRALGLWATGHHVLLRFHGNSCCGRFNHVAGWCRTPRVLDGSSGRVQAGRHLV
jgi:hypothetical protein